MSPSAPRTDRPPSHSHDRLLPQITPVESWPKPDSNSHYLDIPLQTNPSRRSSVESTSSDLSGLSINSAELRQGRRRLLPPSPHDNADPLSSISPHLARHHWRRPGVRSYIDAFWLRNKGVVLVLVAMVFGSVMNVVARLMETDGRHGEAMHPFQILFARMSITVVLSLIYGFYTHIPHFPFGHSSVRRLLVVRGVGGFFGVFGLYWSLMYLPLAEATVLTFLAPILTCYACSILIQGEAFSRQQQIAGFLSLVGVVFIARPGNLFGSSSSSSSGERSATSGAADSSNTTLPLSGPSAPPNSMTTGEVTATPHQHLLAVLYAMLGVLGATIAMTTIRKIGTRAHPLISVNYFSTWCTIVSLVAVLCVRSVGFRLPKNLQEWALLALLGLCGFIMQFLLTAGLAYGGPAAAETEQRPTSNRRVASQHARTDEEAGWQTRATAASLSSPTPPMKSSSGTRATSMLYTQMLFALAFDKWIWGISPGWSSWVGSAIILACAVWVAAAQDMQKTKEEDGKPYDEAFDESGEGLASPDPGSGKLKRKSTRKGQLLKQQLLQKDEEEEAEEEAEERPQRLITHSPPPAPAPAPLFK